MRFVYVLVFLLVACEQKPSSMHDVTGLDGQEFYSYKEDSSTGERFFNVYSFYSRDGWNEVVVYRRYYPTAGQPEFYWSARSGGPFEMKTDGSKVDFTYHYCLTGKTCKETCSTGSCEPWKTVSFSGDGDPESRMTLYSSDGAETLYNSRNYVAPINPNIDITANEDEADELANGEPPVLDANYDELEQFFPD